MKRLIKYGVIMLVLAGIGLYAKRSFSEWWRIRNLPSWRQIEVEQGQIISVVNSTGTVRPVMSVEIGAFVSGPIDPATPLVEFNQEVKQGDVLAIIDQRIYEADVARDEAAVAAQKAAAEAAQAGVESSMASVGVAQAALETRLAEVERAEAQLEQAENDENRAQKLAAENPDFISPAEMDQLKYNRLQLAEQVHVAEASVDQARAAQLQAEAAVSESRASLSRAKASVTQAQANKTRSELNLDYAVITSPVDGIVIDRKIEPGQTLAATFQTPVLFVVAPNMREEMYVYASVDEADIGLIREAQQQQYPVEFTVDAYPDDLFHGSIKEVRFSSTMTQNVVTYPVIITTSNADLKLLPGMTASISFQIEEKKDVVKIPNAALRFYPLAEHVRPEDKEILDGASRDPNDDDTDTQLSAAEQSEASLQRKQRHVWVVDGELLKAVEVVTGIGDSRFTECVSGEVSKGMKLVTGLKDSGT